MLEIDREKYHQYKNHILKRPELTSIPEGYLGEIRTILGESFIQPTTVVQEETAFHYLHGKAKARIERILVKAGLMLGGREVIYLLAKGIEIISPGGKGRYPFEVGFIGLESPEVEKIRTMRPGAHLEIENPFQHTNFLFPGEISFDGRLIAHPFAKFLRRSGLDELPQAEAVAKGLMWLVGPRGYTLKEQEGTRYLLAMLNDPEVPFDEETRKLLESYPSKISWLRPKPSIFGPLSAFKAKDTHWAIRTFIELRYMEIASPLLDFKLFVKAFKRRELKGVGAR